MHLTTFDNLRIGYRKEGEGPAIVLVHGTGGDGATNWDAVAQDLSRDFTIIRPDYTGSGESEDDGRPLTIELLADEVLAAIDHAGHEDFTLVGFSLGASIAARIAADHPGRVRNLVLINGFARPDGWLKLQFALWRDLIASGRASDRETMARLILMTGFSPETVSSWEGETLEQALRETVATQNWDGMARQVEVDLTLDVRDAGEKITAATLVIGCEHDHMVPPAHSRALAASIAGARSIQLPTGHLAPMERPDLVADAIRSFLEAA